MEIKNTIKILKRKISEVYDKTINSKFYKRTRIIFGYIFGFFKLWIGFLFGIVVHYSKKWFLKIRGSKIVLKYLPVREQVKLQPIEIALSELKHELVFLDLFGIILNSVIAFLVCLLICVVFNFGWEWAFVPTLGCFFYFSYMYLKNTRLVNVENKVPELSEKLRTAADNVSRQNEITNDLKDEVLHDMKKIDTKMFFDIDAVAVRMFSILIIAFIIVILSFLNLTFDFQFAPIVSNPVDYIKEMVFSQNVGENVTLAFTEGNLSAVFGNRTDLVKLGNEQLTLTVNPLQSELDFQDVKDAETKNFNPPVYPKEIYTSYDASYTETIAKKNQAVVKSYFEQISK